MVFYDINFKQIIKHFLYSLFIIAFIIVCLLLCSSSVKAVSYDTAYDSTSIQDIETAINSIYEDNNITDAYWMCTKMGSSWFINIYNTDDLLYYDPVSGRVKTDNNVVHTWWYMYSGGTYQYGGIDGGKIYALMAVTNDLPWFYGNVPLYKNDKTTIWWAPSPSSDSDFIFENYEDTTHYADTLVTGDFTYFFFKVKKNPNWDDVPSPCGFYFHDITNFSIPFNTYVNDTTSVFFDLNEQGSFKNHAYLYAFDFSGDYIKYAVSCALPFGSYNNNSTYQLNLFYIDPITDERHEKTYTWTTNFSSDGISKQNAIEDDNMLSNINSLRSLYNKDFNINDNDLTKMFPSSSNYMSPTENGINTIFNSFYNAFTTTETTSFSFEIPFSNGQTISVPSDLVTSRIPSSILYIIQTVYWYIFCRFIVKDIAKIVQKAKSGEIFEDNTSNIKTDLL